ncbi:MAG: efflux RND transporter periplasmic adaptor subunit [Planctomycetes bacterium]|nr:efflux RND transporter periplasmic adaptor subunit [Planctomycetota bacterium]
MSNDTGRRARAAGAAAIVLASLAAGGCTPPPAPPPPPPKVTVVFPELRAVEEHELFNGWTAAVETVDVRARVRGHIETVHFRDGDIVKAGDPLFTLDTRPFQAAVDQARADRKALEAQLVAARKERARLEELLGKGGASQKQVEKQQADVEALEAHIAATAAQVQRAELDLEYARITSPIAGRTSRALLTEGNLVGASGTDPLLTTVVSVDPIHVYFDIPEPSLLKYRAVRQAREPEKLGQPASAKALPFTFALDTDEGWPREGLLDFAENVLDSTTGTLRVRGVVSNPDGFLIAGTRVHVRMVTAAAAEALLVPDAALLADQNMRYVLVVGADGKVQRRDLLPGRLLDDGQRVVLPGRDPERDLRPADRVIVEGQARARLNMPVEALDRDGQPVAPRGAAPAAAPR